MARTAPFHTFLNNTLLCLLAWTPTAFSQAEIADASDPLITIAESSEFKATSTYDQVMELCRELAKSPRVRLASMGSTSQGRDLPLLIVANSPPNSPNELNGRFCQFVLGNIHAGEVCGKEAILMLVRELSRNEHSDLLEGSVLLFAPIYNADGNQPLSTKNRTNQHGPDGGVGQRANGQGLDLNRDHLKLESSEARGFAKLLTEWDPAIIIDTHTTNGSHHRFALTYDGPRSSAAPRNFVNYMRDNFLPEVSRRLKKGSGYDSFYYGNFNPEHDRWNSYPAWPRYGTQYVAVRGRLSILSEAYAYASYRDRVLCTRQFVLDCLSLAHERRAEIRKMFAAQQSRWDKVDFNSEQVKSSDLQLPLRSEAAELDREFTALGYDESTRPKDAPRGTLPTKPQDYQVKFIGLENPIESVRRPYAYVIPAQLKPVIENLKLHGIELEELTEEAKFDVEAYQITKITRAEKPFQNHRLVDVKTSAKTEPFEAGEGTVIARTSQKLGRLLMLLVEPDSQDGLVTWNFLDDWLSTDANRLYPIRRLMRPVDMAVRRMK